MSPAWIRSWLEEVRQQSSFQVDPMDVAGSREWSFTGGGIRHRTGRFFNIVGGTWKTAAGQCAAQPFIEQREIGILGLLIRDAGGRREVLVQAKIEPGNVGVVQLAPTCQATASNVARVHGGDAPPFADAFLGDGRNVIRQTLQSEQGTRFLGKRNLNVLARVNGSATEGPRHRWMAADDLLHLLSVDYLINTDARSVLVCSPWTELAGDPFTRYRDGFETELRRSWEQPADDQLSNAAKTAVVALRRGSAEPAIIGLEDLSGWEVSGSGVRPIGDQPFAVRQIRVTTRGREVPAWDQPIVDSAGDGRVDLVCGRHEGILHFLFRPVAEPGLYHRVELGATITVEPGRASPEASFSVNGGVVRAECRQSEEGGRFFQDSNHYRIIDIGDARGLLDDGYWLHLGHVRELLAAGGWFTNEARTALSLLLTWL